jgi:hypothetical protein
MKLPREDREKRLKKIKDSKVSDPIYKKSVYGFGSLSKVHAVSTL